MDKSFLEKIDREKKEEDLKKNTSFLSLTRNILAVRKHSTATEMEEEFQKIPFYWFHMIYLALSKMILIYPEIQFIAVKSVNYGIRIHHTSNTRVLTQLNKIKADLANAIDEAITSRVIKEIEKC